MSSRLPKSSVSTSPPEWKTSLARITPRPGGHEHERGQAVVAVAPAGQPSRRGSDRGADGAERRREAEPVGEHEPGEGRGADRVGVEGQPAQDDPRADEPPGDAEDPHLDDALLNEGQVERLEHSPFPGRPATHYSIGASSASQSSLLANFVSLVPSFVARNA